MKTPRPHPDVAGKFPVSMADGPVLRVVSETSDDNLPDVRRVIESHSGRNGKPRPSMARTLLQFPEALARAAQAAGHTPDPLRGHQWRPDYAEFQGTAERLDVSQIPALSVTFAEIFDTMPGYIWPVGGPLALKAATALRSLPRVSEPGSMPAGVTRISLTSAGNVEAEGQYPGDDTAIALVATWLYRFAAGRFPVRNESTTPSQLNPRVPRWVDEVCVKGLTQDLSLRYATLDELGFDLEERRLVAKREELSDLVRSVRSRLYPSVEELAGELAGALRVFTSPPPGERVARKKGAWILGMLFVAAALIGLWRVTLPIVSQ